MTDREVMQQALEALERYQVKRQDFDRFADEITALRTALEQQAEPVAWDNCRSKKQCRSWCGNSACASHWENTAPPQRQWVGLEPEEILDLFDRNNIYGSKWIEFVRTVEAKLKERNI